MEIARRVVAPMRGAAKAASPTAVAAPPTDTAPHEPKDAFQQADLASQPGTSAAASHGVAQGNGIEGSRHEVVVVGNGYAGLSAAIELSRYSDVAPTLIASGDHVFKTELAEGAAGKDISMSIDRLCEQHGIKLIRGWSTGHGDEAVHVRLPNEEMLEVPFHALIRAEGAVAKPVPEGVFPFNTLEDALQIRAALEARLSQSEGDVKVIVAGTGPTAKELISLRDEYGPRLSLQLVGRDLGVEDPGALAQRLGVQLTEHVDVVSLTPRGVAVRQADGVVRQLPADLVISALGNSPKAQVPVNAALQAVGENGRVFVAGDKASLVDPASQEAVRPTVLNAAREGQLAARNARAVLAGEPLGEYHQIYPGLIERWGDNYGRADLPVHLGPVRFHVRFNGRLAILSKQLLENAFRSPGGQGYLSPRGMAQGLHETLRWDSLFKKHEPGDYHGGNTSF